MISFFEVVKIFTVLFSEFIPAAFAADDCASRLDSYYFCELVFHVIHLNLY